MSNQIKSLPRCTFQKFAKSQEIYIQFFLVIPCTTLISKGLNQKMVEQTRQMANYIKTEPKIIQTPAIEGQDKGLTADRLRNLRGLMTSFFAGREFTLDKTHKYIKSSSRGFLLFLHFLLQ